MSSTARSGTATGNEDEAGLRILQLEPEHFRERLQDEMGIYVRAMGYPPHTGAQRGLAATSHSTYEGFTCWAALQNERILGFGYGYTSRPGQHWHDLVRRAVTREVASVWLQDAFELSELHVDPPFQAFGVGRALLLSLANSIPHRHLILSTPDTETRAFRFYRKLGFTDLARNHLFPGDVRPFAVLGAELPLPMPWES